MRTHLLLPVTIMVSVALVGVMKIRGKERDKVERRSRFEDIKLRVTNDVLEEYENDVKETKELLEKSETDGKALDGEVNTLWEKDTKKRGEVDTCQAAQKALRDAVASAETEFNNLQDGSTKEKDSWNVELATLKQQLEARSPVCDFIKSGGDTKKLCGEVIIEAPKAEEPKADAPKAKEPKADAPKAEEPKADAPKAEEPKADAPKAEEPKADAPKQR